MVALLILGVEVLGLSEHAIMVLESKLLDLGVSTLFCT